MLFKPRGSLLKQTNAINPFNGFCFKRINGWKLCIRSGWENSKVLEDFCTDHQFNCENEIIPSSNYATVRKIETGGRILFFKELHRRKVLDSVKDFFRGTRAHREAKANFRLKKAGIKAPSVVAVGKKRFQNFIVTKACAAKSVACFTVIKGHQARRKFIKALATDIANLHENGFYHGDLHWNNILINDSGEFVYIDNENTKGKRKIRFSQRLRNLDLLNISALRNNTSRSERLYFYNIYAEASSLEQKDYKPLLVAVEKRSQQRIRSKRRRLELEEEKRNTGKNRIC